MSSYREGIKSVACSSRGVPDIQPHAAAQTLYELAEYFVDFLEAPEVSLDLADQGALSSYLAGSERVDLIVLGGDEPESICQSAAIAIRKIEQWGQPANIIFSGGSSVWKRYHQSEAQVFRNYSFLNYLKERYFIAQQHGKMVIIDNFLDEYSRLLKKNECQPSDPKRPIRPSELVGRLNFSRHGTYFPNLDVIVELLQGDLMDEQFLQAAKGLFAGKDKTVRVYLEEEADCTPGNFLKSVSLLEREGVDRLDRLMMICRDFHVRRSFHTALYGILVAGCGLSQREAYLEAEPLLRFADVVQVDTATKSIFDLLEKRVSGKCLSRKISGAFEGLLLYDIIEDFRSLGGSSRKEEIIKRFFDQPEFNLQSLVERLEQSFDPSRIRFVGALSSRHQELKGLLESHRQGNLNISDMDSLRSRLVETLAEYRRLYCYHGSGVFVHGSLLAPAEFNHAVRKIKIEYLQLVEQLEPDSHSSHSGQDAEFDQLFIGDPPPPSEDFKRVARRLKRRPIPTRRLSR